MCWYDLGMKNKWDGWLWKWHGVGMKNDSILIDGAW